MNTQFEEIKSLLKNKGITELFEEISVIDEWNNQTRGLDGWFGVETPIGIIAYFGSKQEAFGFRLSYINRILNE